MFGPANSDKVRNVSVARVQNKIESTLKNIYTPNFYQVFQIWYKKKIDLSFLHLKFLHKLGSLILSLTGAAPT